MPERLAGLERYAVRLSARTLEALPELTVPELTLAEPARPEPAQ